MGKRIVLILLSFLLLSGGNIYPLRLMVPVEYSTIQAAINNAADGDSVIIQPGTYYENINFNGKNILVGSYQVITGNNVFIGTTIIDGNNNGSVVTFTNNEDSTAVLKGLTLKHGSGKLVISYHSKSVYGGAVYCVAAGPTLDNNVINQNTVFIDTGTCQGYGAGIYCSGSKARIINNTISHNLAYRSNEQNTYFSIGGGIFANESDLLIQGNRISANKAKMGAGIAIQESHVEIENNDIYQNEAFSMAFGGGIGLNSSSSDLFRIIVKNNIIRENIGYYGTGIMCLTTAALIEGNLIYNNSDMAVACQLGFDTLRNNTICNNLGPGLYVSNNAGPVVENSIFWDNAYDEILDVTAGDLQVTCCLVKGGWEGAGNIDANPQFCDPDNNNYTVNFFSPCLPENNSCGVLMGVEEAGCDLLCGDANGDHQVNLADVSYLIVYYFQAGAGPYNADMADLNNNGKIELADIIFLILYINDPAMEVWCDVFSPVE